MAKTKNHQTRHKIGGELVSSWTWTPCQPHGVTSRWITHFKFFYTTSGSRDSLLVKSAGLVIESGKIESRQERPENVLFQSWLCVLTLIRCPFHPHDTQWHVKDPGHSAKSAGGRLLLYTRTPLAQRSRSGLTMPLFRHSVGTSSETSSHATCQRTFGHSGLSSLSHCGLMLA